MPDSTAKMAASKFLQTFVEECTAIVDVEVVDNASPPCLRDLQKRRKSPSLYGELYEPFEILESLLVMVSSSDRDGDEELVGVPKVPSIDPAPVSLRSEPYECTPYLNLIEEGQILSSPMIQEWHEIPLMIRNSIRLGDRTNGTRLARIRVRWVDENYQTKDTHTWDLLPHHSGDKNDTNDSPMKTWIQYCKPGNLFLFSILETEAKETRASDDNIRGECLLGAYRPLRPLPSGSFHSIVIGVKGDCDQNDDGEYVVVGEPDYSNLKSDGDSEPVGQQSTSSDASYRVESVLTNPYDVLCVASSELDPIYSTAGSSIGATTIQLLTTILTNLLHHPYEEKYHRLRLSNSKIQRHLLSSWAAMQFLTIGGGFENEHDEGKMSDFLVAASSPSNPSTSPEELVALAQVRSQSLKLLEILSNHCLPTFVRDLAPPTPWASVVPGNKGRPNWGDHGRGGFISDDEKWERAERNAQRNRSGGGRRPNPGDAPSSRGKWGR